MKLNSEQQAAVQAFSDGHSFLLTGSAGTGKTSVLSKILESAKGCGLTAGLTAMTGAAALLIGGKTLHSYLGIGLGDDPVQDIIKRIRFVKTISSRWKALDLLIIDEVSMLTAELLEKINHIAKVLRHDPRPMGGIQTILCGDFYQLPPVSTDKKAKFCFKADSWPAIVPKVVQLTEIMRQTDPLFQKCLSQIRLGSCPPDVEEVLRSRTTQAIHADGIEPTRLYTRNADTDRINQKSLKELNMPIEEYHSSYSQSTNQPRHAKAVERLKNFIDKSAPCVDTLKLCLNVQVMLINNMDFDRGLVNGSRGVVTSFENGLPVVRFLNGIETTIEEHAWSIKDEDSTVTVSKRQIPLKLAYAITIHKSQGCTLDLVEVDIGRSIFEPGQAYVALSRVRSLEGLYILDFDPSRIRAHPEVTAFYAEMSSDSNVSSNS